MSPTAPAPALSIQGTWNALRVPLLRDYVFSAKAALAVALSLLIGFSQNLENPYWSALTVYVLVGQPEAGAIRSKAIFRLIGTVLGGTIAILLAAVFASDVGALLIGSVVAILATYYGKTLDRTPANYIWFTAPLTIAVVAIAQAAAPQTIFLVAMNRMLEIGLAIVLVGLIDSVFVPRAATPGFIHLMTDWRNRAGIWAGAALSPDAQQTDEARRLGLHTLTSLLGPLDAAGVQLPYDIVAVPPRRRDMRLVRLLVARLIVDLSSAQIWIGAACGPASSLVGQVRDWIIEQPGFADNAICVHAQRGHDLCDRLARDYAHCADDPAGLLQAAALQHLADFVCHWSQLEQMLHAIATGTRAPPPLRDAARRARPVRSIDYAIGLLDMAPLALALGICAALWYFTTWTASLSAMVFVVIALGFILGTPGVLRSSRGVAAWIAIASAITLIYQFVILPQVTAFPVLLAVLMAALVPLGLLVAMSPAGVLILANAFGFLGLQSAYNADFAVTLEVLGGSLAGCAIAYGALHLCQYDRARFAARRLARALRHDLIDVAHSHRCPDPDRLLSLGVDRLALYFGIVDKLPPGDPLHANDLFTLFRIAKTLLRLREHEMAGPALATLRANIAVQFADRVNPDRDALRQQVEVAYQVAVDLPASPPRAQALVALLGLRLALAG